MKCGNPRFWLPARAAIGAYKRCGNIGGNQNLIFAGYHLPDINTRAANRLHRAGNNDGIVKTRRALVFQLHLCDRIRALALFMRSALIKGLSSLISITSGASIGREGLVTQLPSTICAANTAPASGAL